MANPHRGSVALQAGDKAFALSFSINAICELEDLTGKPIGILAQDLQNPSGIAMSSVRQLIWAGLRDHQPDMDLKGAGDVIEAAGMDNCMEAVGRAFALAFPQPDQGKTKGSRPTKAGRR